MVRIESNTNFQPRSQGQPGNEVGQFSVTLSIKWSLNIQFPLQTRHALLSSPLIPNILNKSPSSAFRPALSNLWLLLVYILNYFLSYRAWAACDLGHGRPEIF